MSEALSRLIWLRDSRLTPLALGPQPAWMWSLDGKRIIWANPTGAAIFGAAMPGALASQCVERGDVTSEIAALAATLPADGSSRFERLRGISGTEQPLTCRCARIKLDDNAEAILIASAEPAGPELTLSEQVERLLANTDAPVAAFGTDGMLIHATPAAMACLAGVRMLAGLGADAMTIIAPATLDTPAGRLAIDRAGAVLFVTFDAATTARPRREPTELEERQQPLRFVWQIDADGRFTLDSEEFATLSGAHAALGRTWDDISAALELDPEGQIALALATRDTWSGLAIAWPVDADGTRLTVELSGLPVFDRERRFRGYRGFGVCRDLECLNALSRRAAAATARPTGSQDACAGDARGFEATAFDEIARRLADADQRQAQGRSASAASEPAPEIEPPIAKPLSETVRVIGPILDRLPVGVLIYRLNDLIYANRVFLRWTGYDSVAALAQAGGIESLLIGSDSDESSGEAPFTITGSRGESVPVAGRLFSVPWEGDRAFALITTSVTPPVPEADTPPDESMALADAQSEIAELRAILDVTNEAIVVLDGDLRVVSVNRCARALFGIDTLVGMPFTNLFAPASANAVLDQIGKLTEGLEGEPLEVSARSGAPVALSLTIGRLGTDRLCAVLRDLTPWRKSEAGLVSARRQAEKQSAAKSEFLAKVSHEIRNPLNAIVGFSELMMEERFGAIGNDRYRQYLKDIHASGGHIMALVNDLLDLSKIESGRLELAFSGVALNELIEESVALLQPQANRVRVIVRTSLAPRLPPVTADARSLRQIVNNLVSNSIKFTGAGGQVIVSTARTDMGAVVLRVRDTGIGMSHEELASALEPSRQVTARAGGTGIGLPLSKALAEANGASLRVESRPGAGTLVEVVFPPERVVG
jgi:signal transduction histidine kinase